MLSEIEELNRLADLLENQSADWREHDIFAHPHPMPCGNRCPEETRRATVLWDSAIAAGAIFVRLSERGALSDLPRIRIAVDQIRSELAKSRRGGDPPWSLHVVNVSYDPHRECSYDVYFVKLFQSLCKIFATSFVDRRDFDLYYGTRKEQAAFHVRMLRAFSKKLRERCEAKT